MKRAEKCPKSQFMEAASCDDSSQKRKVTAKKWYEMGYVSKAQKMQFRPWPDCLDQKNVSPCKM